MDNPKKNEKYYLIKIYLNPVNKCDCRKRKNLHNIGNNLTIYIKNGII